MKTAVKESLTLAARKNAELASQQRCTISIFRYQFNINYSVCRLININTNINYFKGGYQYQYLINFSKSSLINFNINLCYQYPLMILLILPIAYQLVIVININIDIN